MEKETLFKELQELLDLAKTKGNQIEKKEIISYFSDLKLDENLINILCDYFVEAGIKVEGYEFAIKEQKQLSEEERGVIRFYEEELENLPSLTEKEKEVLFQKHQDGEDVRDAIISYMLPRVVSIAKDYIGEGVLFGDLIQEGNMELMEALMEVESESKLEAYLEERIHQAMKDLIVEQKGSHNVGIEMAKKANKLDEASQYLAKEYGREATAEELAQYLSMEVDEIKDIMKLSLDAISVVNTEITPTE